MPRLTRAWRWCVDAIGRSGRVTAIILLLAALVARDRDPEILQLFRAKTFDLYQQLKPRPFRADTPVVVVDIDEKSLAEQGQWPWPRTSIASLVGHLTAANAAVIGFDVVFSEPDRTSPALLAESLPGLDGATRDQLRALPSNDAAFAAAIAASGRVVLGQPSITEARPPAPPLARTSFAVAGPDPVPYIDGHVDILPNLPALHAAAAGRGLIIVSREIQDGIVRQVPLLAHVGDVLYPSLALEMLRVAVGAKTIFVSTEDPFGVRAVAVSQTGSNERLVIPTDAHGNIWTYFTPHAAYAANYVSATDVLGGRVDPKRLAGKLVLVGTSAQALQDVRASPLDHNLPGVEVHANILENVLFNTFLRRPAEAQGVEELAAILIGIVMIVVTPMAGARIGMVTFVALAGGFTWWSWNAFSTRLELYDPAFAGVVTLLLYVFLTYVGYTREEDSRRQVRTAFRQYLSPALVERLARDPGQLALGGENRDMTFLFSDVRGFTAISELFDAAGLTRLINRLMTPLTNVILATEGTIDKYMGDCIMAFWNAPLDVADHAHAGARAALAMIPEIAKVNTALEAEAHAAGRPHMPITMGVGLNSGIACVGNMGSDQRFDYSVLGDNVNLASRLEGQSKTYGVTIVVGENTAALIADFALVELDLIRVKGRHQAVRIFALVGDAATARDPAFVAVAQAQAALLKAYRGRDWDAAEAVIEASRPGLNAARGLLAEIAAVHALYAARIAACRRAPPQDGWDGVYEATEK